MLWTSLQNGAFPCKSYRPMLASGRSGRCASPPALWWELQLILMQLFLQEDAAITMNGSNSGDKEDPCLHGPCSAWTQQLLMAALITPACGFCLQSDSRQRAPVPQCQQLRRWGPSTRAVAVHSRQSPASDLQGSALTRNFLHRPAGNLRLHHESSPGLSRLELLFPLLRVHLHSGWPSEWTC